MRISVLYYTQPFLPARSQLPRLQITTGQGHMAVERWLRAHVGWGLARGGGAGGGGGGDTDTGLCLFYMRQRIKTKKALIGIMRVRGGFLKAPHAEGELGCIAQYPTAYYCNI
jgi:hypothetical protein